MAPCFARNGITVVVEFFTLRRSHNLVGKLGDDEHRARRFADSGQRKNRN